MSDAKYTPLYVTWDGAGESELWLSIGPEEDDGADAIAFSQTFARGIPKEVADAFYLIAAAPELLAAAEALLPEVERLRECLAKVHDGYPEELAAAEVRASELRAVIAKVRG